MREYALLALLSLAALTADFAYEGARSALGLYLLELGAPPFIAGLLPLGELIANITRVLSGLIARGKRVWAFLMCGYSTNLVIPLLAYAPSWPFVFVAAFIERLGKGVRGPCKDVLIYATSSRIGRGRGFGIYEFFDQIGAISGSAYMSWAIGGIGLRQAFLYLLTPVLASMAFVIMAFLTMPITPEGKAMRKRHRIPWRIFIPACVLSLGTAHWGLLTYHLKAYMGVQDDLVPLLYAIAMAVDAVSALILGFLYDLIGVWALAIPCLTNAISALPLFEKGLYPAVMAIAFWGVTIGAFESAFKAAVGDFAGDGGAAAYAAYGVLISLFAFIGNAVIGLLWALNPLALPIMCLITSALSLLALRLCFKSGVNESG